MAIFRRRALNGCVECKGSMKNHDFRPISRFISETMQDRAIVLNSTQLKFIKNSSLKAGIKEHRTHQNYKNTKLHIARLNRETNKRKHKKKQKKTHQHLSPGLARFTPAECGWFCMFLTSYCHVYWCCFQRVCVLVCVSVWCLETCL